MKKRGPKLYRYLWMLLALFFIVSFLLIEMRRKPLILSPANSDRLSYTANCDEGSRISLSHDSLLLSMSYAVGDSVENPYAGAGILFEEHLDLSKFQYVELTVNSYNSNDCRVLLTDFLENFSHPENLLTHRYWVYDLLINRGKQVYRIPLDGFSTPGWWYKVAGIKADEIPANSGIKKRISTIHFYNHPTAEYNLEKSLEVREIRFIRRQSALPAVSLGVIGVAAFIVMILSRKKSAGISGYRQVELRSERDRSEELLIAYIHENYADAGLTLSRVFQDTGIPEHQIRALLKGLGAENFRHYINEIRITEACRLLRESENQIKEIAHSVGFGHISSFNRTFTKFRGESPLSYRQK